MGDIDIDRIYDEMQANALSHPTHKNLQRYLLLAIYKFIPTLNGNDIYKMKWYRDGIHTPYVILDTKLLKLKSGLEIELSDEVIEILKSLKEFIDSDYVFSNLANYKKCRSPSGHCKFMNEIFGENVSSRKIRKDYVTGLLKQGLDLKQIQEKTKLSVSQIMAAININELIKPVVAD